jgi:hypothetical protein
MLDSIPLVILCLSVLDIYSNISLKNPISRLFQAGHMGQLSIIPFFHYISIQRFIRGYKFCLPLLLLRNKTKEVRKAG